MPDIYPDPYNFDPDETPSESDSVDPSVTIVFSQNPEGGYIGLMDCNGDLKLVNGSLDDVAGEAEGFWSAMIKERTQGLGE